MNANEKKYIARANADVLRHLGMLKNDTCICRNCFVVNKTFRLAEDVAKISEAKKARLDSYRKEAVRFSNGVRYFLTLDPTDHIEQGVLASGPHCPISNTVRRATYELDVVTTHDMLRVTRGGEDLFKTRVPYKVKQFLIAFDNGEYPDLIEIT